MDLDFTSHAIVYLMIIATLIFLFVYWRKRKVITKPLPGPFRLPLLGTIYKHGIMFKNDTLTNLSKVYGPIYRVYFGHLPVVIINDLATIQAVWKRPSEFGDRPAKYSFSVRQIRTNKLCAFFAKDYNADLIKQRIYAWAHFESLG